MAHKNVIASTVRGFATLVILAAISDPAFASQAVQNMSTYTWVVVYAGLFAVIAAYGIGANDVANAFASSVGAKALTMQQAVVLAVIFEFLGAVLLGNHVSETMRKGIADPLCFEDNPALLMWGMTCVIQAVGFWLILASYLEMPVSTTHSTVGAIIGMTMMCRSSSCVIWYEKKDEFPYIGGVSAIIVSWVLSPVASGFCAAALYFVTYHCVLKWKEDSFRYSKIFFPFVVAFTIGLNVVFMILKGASGQKETLGTEDMVSEAKDGDMSKVLVVGSVAAAIAFVITAAFIPHLTRRVEADVLLLETAATDMEKKTGGDLEISEQESQLSRFLKSEAGVSAQEIKMFEIFGVESLRDLSDEHIINDAMLQNEIGLAPSKLSKFKAALALKLAQNKKTSPILVEKSKDEGKGGKPQTTAEPALDADESSTVLSVFSELNQDPYASLKTDKKVGDMHKNVERHDVRTEEMFKYVQVFTAVVDSFSHGANDVANAMGPFAAVYLTHKNGYVAEKDDVGDDMYWILALGGLGLGVGLSTYGYKIMLAIGVKLAAITPSRGFCIELGAAFVIIFGTTQGWPLSTTHCQVGATVGVGMFEGRGGVNWWIFAKCIIGWVITLVIAGFTAALLVGPSPDPAKSEYCD